MSPAPLKTLRNMMSRLWSQDTQKTPEQIEISRLRESYLALDSQLIHVQQELQKWEMLFALGQDGTGGSESLRMKTIQDSRDLFEWSPESGSAVLHYTGVAVGTTLSIKLTPVDNEDSRLDQDDTPQKLFDEIFESEDNEVVFSVDARQKNSNRFLVDGEMAYTFFVNPDSGFIKVRPVDSVQIRLFVSNPEDVSEIWFYKRVWTPIGQTEQRVLYYRHWKLKDEDRDEAVAWLVGPKGPIQRESIGSLATSQSGRQDVLMEVLVWDTIKRRGNPLLKRAIAWIRQNTRFVENRATIVRNRATYLDEYTISGGSRATASVRQSLESSYARSSGVFGVDTNPASAAGSSLIHNKAVKSNQRSVATGSEDAERDARIFRAQVSSGVGIPIALLYMDAEASGNLNAIIELMRRAEHRWSSYRSVWHSFWKSFAVFVLRVRNWEGDVLIDIDAPPIIQDDLKEYTDAVINGLDSALVPPLEASRLYLTRLGSNNIDEILDQVEDLVARKAELTLQMAQLGAQTNVAQNDSETETETEEHEPDIHTTVRMVMEDLGETIETNGRVRAEKRVW